jgi:hypothetical protein
MILFVSRFRLPLLGLLLMVACLLARGTFKTETSFQPLMIFESTGVDSSITETQPDWFDINLSGLSLADARQVCLKAAGMKMKGAVVCCSSDPQIPELARCKSLERLVVCLPEYRTQDRISACSVRAISSLPHLKDLELNGHFAPASLDELKSTRLTSLSMHGYQHDNYRFLSGVPNLEVLALESCLFDDKTLKCVGKLHKLTQLYGPEDRITPTGIGYLAGCSNLEHFPLPRKDVDAALEAARPLTNVKRIWIWSEDLTDDGLAYLDNKPHLQELSLDWAENLSEDGFRRMGKHDLKKLTVFSRDYVSDSAIELLVAQCAPAADISIYGANVAAKSTCRGGRIKIDHVTRIKPHLVEMLRAQRFLLRSKICSAECAQLGLSWVFYLLSAMRVI